MTGRLFVTLVAAIAPLVGAIPAGPAAAQEGPVAVARGAEPVVLSGADLPSWSRLPAVGVANTDPPNVPGDSDFRTAHNGTLTVPPDSRSGVPVDRIAAFRWNEQANRFTEIPVQVDEMFPYFLANEPSDFAWYSGTDKELTYEWDTEAWKMTAGECFKQYPPGDPGPMQDPVTTLDDDDEIAFMASARRPRPVPWARRTPAPPASRSRWWTR